MVFDCVDLYVELLILLNCEFLGKCKTCTYIIKWIIDILMQKWDTIRFVDFDTVMQLANEIKILIFSSPLVDYYIEKQRRLSEICKRAKYECDLELVLENKDFFIEKNKNYLALTQFIFDKIKTELDFYRVDDFKYVFF